MTTGEDMEDLNDIRLALGALTNTLRSVDERVEHIGERLDDVTAMAARQSALTELLDDLETIVAELPAGIRKFKQDPMLGSLAGPYIEEIAASIEEAVTARRVQRAAAPGIEKV